MMELFFNATLQDWQAISREWWKLAQVLDKGHEVRLVGNQTDLTFSVKGRKWLVGDGHINMPDGEIFTAPANSTLNGHIYFEFPGVLGGRLVHDIFLEWENGKLVKATASRNEDYLHKVLETDGGASLLGEFAIGTNYGIDRFCKDILIDEKIGGTVHIALGRAYEMCGGTNQSAIHWDIIKDTRTEGAIYLDGNLIFEKGHFVIEP
jgi:aminopeptidase